MRERDTQEDRQGVEAIGTVTPAPPQRPGAGVVLDTEKYTGLLADEDLSTDQEREYIETVWAILLQAMLLGIRLEFEAESCGQLSESPSAPPLSGGNRVEWNGSVFSNNFNSTAGEVGATEGSKE